MAPSTLKGKGAIVTGAGSGINLAFARALHYEGCNVLIMDIALHSDAVEWMNSLISTGDEAGGAAKVSFYKGDAADWKELEHVFDVYANEFGGVPYIVCPGAGIYEPSHNGFWNDADIDNHYKVLDLNLLHPIKMTRIATRKMQQHNAPGVIICISSIAAQRSSIIAPLYQVSKHGISSFVRGMGSLYDLCGIRVVGVAPGVIRTPLFTEHPEASRFVDLNTDFMLPPEEVARGMIALVTDANYAPGTILEVADLGKWREVQLLNDPGPQGRATGTIRKQDVLEDVKKILEEDRKTGAYKESIA